MTDHILTMAEALDMIRKAPRGSRFMLSARCELPIEGKPDKVFPGFAVIPVSRTLALKYIGDVLAGFNERGARIRIGVNPSAYKEGRTYYHIG